MIQDTGTSRNEISGASKQQSLKQNPGLSALKVHPLRDTLSLYCIEQSPPVPKGSDEKRLLVTLC